MTKKMKQPFYKKEDRVFIRGINKKAIVKDVADNKVKLTYFSRDTDKRITAWFDVSQVEEYKPRAEGGFVDINKINVPTPDYVLTNDQIKSLFSKVSEDTSNRAKRVGDAMKEVGQKLQSLQIKVKYFADIEPLQKITKGNWIDLRSAVDIELKKGEYALIPLGIGMKLPDGYEAYPVPRSSTFKNFGIIQTNHFGVIDNSYSGNEDQWHFPALAMRDTVIKKNDRICQFRIQEVMPEVEFITVDELDDVSRGGFGSTGKP